MSEYQYVEVADGSDIPPGERIIVEIGDLVIVVFNVGGRFYAIGDVCTHDGGPLGDGELEDHEIICPRHGARFDIRNGRAVRFPAVTPTSSHPVRVVNGRVEIGISNT